MSKLPPPGVMDGEMYFPTTNRELCCYPDFETEPGGASYVRIIDHRGVELQHFRASEFQRLPCDNLGALLNAIFIGCGPIQRHIDNKS